MGKFSRHRRCMVLSVALGALAILFALASCNSGGATGDAAPSEDGTPPPTTNSSSYVSTLAIPPGAECATGGVRIEMGIDDNGNGVLDPAEVDASLVICNGTDGQGMIVAATTEPAGSNCTAGGVRIESGADLDGDGMLDPGEIASTFYVCDGVDGFNSLITSSPEPEGNNCAKGGTKIQVGLDLSRDNILDPVEVTGTEYICLPETAALDGLFFTADKEADGIHDLWRANQDGSRTGIVSDPDAGSEVWDFKVSPDGNKVAYRQRDDDPGSLDLFVVDFTNGARRIKVNFARAHTGTAAVLSDYQWSPDSLKIAFLHNDAIAGAFGLHVHMLGGSTNRVVTLPDATRNVVSFKWRPLDSAYLAFVSDFAMDNVYEMWRVSTSGSLLRLVRLTVPGANVAVGSNDIAWSPDGLRIAYKADEFADNITELFTVPWDASTAPVKVSGTIVPSGDVWEFAWAPNGSRIVYVADQEVDMQYELYTTLPASAASVVNVSGSMVLNGNVQPGYQWAPDSLRIAFRADRLTDEVYQLFTVVPTSTFPTNASGSMLPASDVSSFEWAPNASRIAFLADKVTDEKYELYTVQPNGSKEFKVSGNLVSPSSDVNAYSWAPNSSRIAYSADQDVVFVDELYTVAENGTNNNKVSGPTVAFSTVVTDFVWKPDSSRIAYAADYETDGIIEAFVASPSGSEFFKVSGLMQPLGDVGGIGW